MSRLRLKFIFGRPYGEDLSQDSALAGEFKTIIIIATRGEQEIVCPVLTSSLCWSRPTLTSIKEIVVPTQSQILNPTPPAAD
jgi:hypothetical protein